MRTLLLAGLACAATHTAAAQSRDTCPPPRPLGNATTITLAGGYNVFVEAPEVHRAGDETWLIGKFGLVWRQEGDSLADARMVGGIALSVADVAREIPSPPGFTQILAPALSPQPGGVGVFWGRMDDTVSQLRATTFFWAVWNGAAWTPPESTRASRELNWHQLSRSALVARNDTLFIAAAAAAPERHISLFRRAGGRWSETTVSTDGSRLYVELAATDRVLVLLSIGEHGTGRAVLAQTSRDGGESWSEPVVVEPLGGSQNAFDPALYPQPDGTVLGIWSRSPVMSALADALVVASRSTSGTWEVRSRRATPGSFWGLWTTPARDGMHAVIRRVDSGALQYVGWSSSRWCEGALPGAEDGMPNPVWNVSGPGRLDMFWGERTRLSLPVMKVRSFAVCCH